MKTKAVRIHGKMDLRLEEFELPDAQSGEILVKVMTDSVCMSSYKIALQGEKHYRVPDDVAERPTIIGHEFCGEVAQVGSRWKGQYQVGDKVIIPPVLEYLGGVSAIGYSFPEIGGDSTYSLVREHIIENGYLMKVNSDSFFRASLVEPVSCVLRGFKGTFHVDRDGNHVTGLKPGGKLAILAGCGPMGLEAIDLALHSDFSPSLVVVTDLNRNRLNRAERFFPPSEAKKRGIELIFSDSSDTSELMKLSGGKGYDDAFVFVASAPLVELADSLLAFDGCLNLFSGPVDKNFNAKLNFYNVHYAQHHVSGTSGSSTEDMKEVLRLVNMGNINPAVMITHIGGLDVAADTTLNLPQIRGGKKLIYTHIKLPLTAISDFEKMGEKDERFAELHAIVEKSNGLWCSEAEKYLLEHF